MRSFVNKLHKRCHPISAATPARKENTHPHSVIAPGGTYLHIKFSLF